MAKGREKVQQLGFFDVEVSVPEHDTVQLWAYERADAIFRLAYPKLFTGAWRQQELLPWIPLDYGREQLIKRAEEFANETTRPDPRITRKSLSYVLQRATGYGGKYVQIVGYADILVETQFPIVMAAEQKGDVALGWREGPSFLIEAKSKLPTLGELMRQIQLYRTAFSGKVVVVSPDDAYRSILEEQDVLFVQYTT